MYSFYKSFFSENRALKFADELKAQGVIDIELTSARDGFGQTVYRIGWNI